MIHTGIQMTPNNHILAERRGGGRTCNGEEEEDEEEKQAAADARVFICARLVTCTRIRLHAYARMERDTQAQRRRGAPVVSLGEVPGVSLSGLLGPSLSFYHRIYDPSSSFSSMRRLAPAIDLLLARSHRRRFSIIRRIAL